MLKISPVKIIAGIAAVLLAVGVMFYASEARQATVDTLGSVRLGRSASDAHRTQPAEPSAMASGVRVIPIGVAPITAPAKAGSANAGRSSGG